MNNASTGNTITANLTDWDKLKLLTDEEIIHDADSPKTSKADWTQGFISRSTTELHTQTTQRKRTANQLSTQEQVAIRYDIAVLAYFRATGKGWQNRMNEALKEWVKTHAV